MAGSYEHCIRDNGALRDGSRESGYNNDLPLLDNMEDAYEAIEQMYYMIQFLSKGDQMKIDKAVKNYYRVR